MTRRRASRQPAPPKLKRALPRLIPVCSLLALVIFAVYWRVVQNGFINFDDDVYVTANRQIQNGLTWEGLRWAFTSVSYVYFQPVTWISHMLDVTWFGFDPAGHHLVSLGLHAATSVMLLAWLFEATGHLWRSACAAALFALHPLRVESVAWAAERKDVLSAFFFLAALIAYSRYANRPSLNRYLITAALFTLGLLSKPMLVAAPVLFLVADFWPLRRPRSFTYLIREKIPLLCLATMAAVLTYIGQKQAGAMGMLRPLTLFDRAGNAVVSYTRYLGKIFWPYPLTVLYPYDSNLAFWRIALAVILFAAVTGAVLRVRKSRPYLLAGWLWFTVGLFPAIGLVQVGVQAFADRFSYIPSIGLTMAIVWWGGDLMERFRWPSRVVGAVLASLLLLLSAVTWVQLGYWRDSIALMQYTVDHTGPNPVAEQNLGSALGDKNRNAEALVHLAAAVRSEPGMFQAQYNLGKAQAAAGLAQAAIGSFSRAVSLKPDYGEAYYARAVMYQNTGQTEKAGPDLQLALRYGLAPLYEAEAHNNLGVLAAKSGDVERAAAQFELAVRIRPDFPAARTNLSLALAQLASQKSKSAVIN